MKGQIYLILTIFLSLIVVFSGCISTGGIESALLANTAIEQFKASHPNAEFQTSLWDAEDLLENESKVNFLCGKSLDSAEYYYFKLSENYDVVEGFATKDNFELVCVKSQVVNNSDLVDGADVNLIIKSTYNYGNMTNVPYLLFNYGCDLGHVFWVSKIADEKRHSAWANNQNAEVGWDVENNLALKLNSLNLDSEGTCNEIHYYYFNPDNEIKKTLPVGKYVLGIFKEDYEFSSDLTISANTFVSSDYGVLNNIYDKIVGLEFELGTNKQVNIVVNNSTPDELTDFEEDEGFYSTELKVQGYDDYGRMPDSVELSLITMNGEVLDHKTLNYGEEITFEINNDMGPFIIRSEDGKVISWNPNQGYGMPPIYGYRYQSLKMKDGEFYLQRYDDHAGVPPLSDYYRVYNYGWINNAEDIDDYTPDELEYKLDVVIVDSLKDNSIIGDNYFALQDQSGNNLGIGNTAVGHTVTFNLYGISKVFDIVPSLDFFVLPEDIEIVEYNGTKKLKYKFDGRQKESIHRDGLFVLNAYIDNAKTQRTVEFYVQDQEYNLVDSLSIGDFELQDLEGNYIESRREFNDGMLSFGINRFGNFKVVSNNEDYDCGEYEYNMFINSFGYLELYVGHPGGSHGTYYLNDDDSMAVGVCNYNLEGFTEEDDNPVDNNFYSIDMVVKGINNVNRMPESVELILITINDEILDRKTLNYGEEITFEINTDTDPFVIRSENGKVSGSNPNFGYGNPPIYGYRYETLKFNDGKYYLIRYDDGAGYNLSANDYRVSNYNVAYPSEDLIYDTPIVGKN